MPEMSILEMRPVQTFPAPSNEHLTPSSTTFVLSLNGTLLGLDRDLGCPASSSCAYFWPQDSWAPDAGAGVQKHACRPHARLPHEAVIQSPGVTSIGGPARFFMPFGSLIASSLIRPPTGEPFSRWRWRYLLVRDYRPELAQLGPSGYTQA
jgi:hypothetical protein